MKLLGFKKTTVNGKTFTLADSAGTCYPKQLGLADDFCGGSIKELRKTKYGIYMCLDKRENILFLGYTDKSLTDEGRKLLGLEPLPFELIPEIHGEQIVNMEYAIKETNRARLIQKAKTLGVKGKLATLKTEVLVEKIKEAEAKANDKV